MSHMKTKIASSVLFFFWSGLILSAFFIAQKPVAIQALAGIGSFVWTLLMVILVILNAAALGHQILGRLVNDQLERFLLGTGLGLGIFGLAGFGLAIIGWARLPVLLVILLGMLIWQLFRGAIPAVLDAVRALAVTLRDSCQGVPFWMPFAAAITAILTFILALAPPADAFDALIYHLAVPELWLRDGGLRLFDMPPYWFPSLVEGLNVWPLVLGNDLGAQLYHFTFGLLAILLLWLWVRSLWGDQTGWWVIILSLTMPSLKWLAAWAYTDLALVFFALGMLYSLWKWLDADDPRWLMVTAAMSGLAMGVKYTSFLVPVVAGCFILFKVFSKNISRQDRQKNLLDVIRFSAVALLIASPWYLRNWVWMHNPFYPFVFGGPFWDSFRANWYTASGSGIGWNLKELALLPLNMTIDYGEAFNNFNGQIGPFFLILFPPVFWILWKSRLDQSVSKRKALMVVCLFSVSNVAFWTYGVINSAGLWQMRLLFPGLVPLLMPMAIAVQEIKRLNTPSLRISFIFSALVGLFIFSTLLDFGLLILVRNPFMPALGLQTRQEYLSKTLPEYAVALDWLEKTPVNARIYFLCEQRFYGIQRNVQPDVNNDNLAHDFYLYGNAEGVISAWQAKGYTYALLSRRQLNVLRDSNPTLTPGAWLEESRLEKMLPVVSVSPGGEFVLYAIPPK
jgi:4-amino-4-deoxy-L-arabinose transferase-like glycosyltransferase